MSIIRIGSNDKYASGWETAFGKSKKKAAGSGTKTAATKKATKKSTKKSAKKKKG